MQLVPVLVKTGFLFDTRRYTMNFIEMLTKGMPEFKDVGNMTEKEMQEYAKELADACHVIYCCADAICSFLYKADLIPTYDSDKLKKDIVDAFTECLFEAQTGLDMEEPKPLKEARTKGVEIWDQNKPLNLPEMNRVVFYQPAYGPSVAWEPVVMRGFDLRDPSVRELRFLDTDYLICFEDGDVDLDDGMYFLDGPAVIYAIDKNEHIRSLTDDEIMKIISKCLSEEEDLGPGEAPVLRLC